MSLNLGIIASSRGATAPPSALLLDTYPNARTAVSFRKLRSAYTGNCIRVRRSSDSALLDIGFVNNILDTATLTTFIGANSGFINIWYDQSTLGNNFIQSTSANQPAIIISGVLQTVNGKPAINFNNSNSSLFVTTTFVGATNTFDVTRTSDTNYVLYHGGSNSFAFIGASTQGSTNTLVDGNQAVVSSIYKNNVLQTLPLTRGASYNIISTNTQILLSYVFNVVANYVLLNFSGYSAFEFVGFKQEFIMYNQQTPNISGINSNINSFYSIY
jgi:hypothetical protein